jgi:hypothetical protein
MLGFLVDKIGFRISLMMVSGLVFLSAHILLGVIPMCDEVCYTSIAPFALLGVSYSIYVSSLWPSIPYVVPSRTIGTAYGLTTAI